MKTIVPCCGRSTRYATEMPKWMLPGHDGRPMVALALEGLALNPEDVVVTILREHEERFRVTRGLAEALGPGVGVVILEQPTRSQAETVARTLEALSLREPFLVKDSDNTFALDALAQDWNYVCVDSLNNHDSINPRNKSYLQVDHQDLVTNIREKVVISDLFSVGGYYFCDPADFLRLYERLSRRDNAWERECYISDVIGALILEGTPFKARRVNRYQDWGTLHDWKHALLSRRSYLASLDGFVFERGSRFFEPRFDKVEAKPEAVAALRALADQGHRILYLSIRPPELAALTEAQLSAAGVPAGAIVYDCPVSSWTLVTAPHDSLPFRTAEALELLPDDANLVEKLGPES